LIPNFASEPIPSLANSNCKFEVCLSKLAVYLLEGLADIQTDLRIHTEHGHEEVKSEVVFQLVHLFRNLVGIYVMFVVAAQ